MRPTWDQYFMEIAEVAQKRSTCLRRQVGAVIVKENKIMATGYNGAPKGVKHCGELGCMREKLQIPSGQRHELCRALHAEQNAIIQVANLGASIENATLYCTHHPCVICAKMIINCNLKRVVIKEGYPDELAKELFDEAGITVEMLQR